MLKDWVLMSSIGWTVVCSQCTFMYGSIHSPLADLGTAGTSNFQVSLRWQYLLACLLTYACIKFCLCCLCRCYPLGVGLMMVYYRSLFTWGAVFRGWKQELSCFFLFTEFCMPSLLKSLLEILLRRSVKSVAASWTLPDLGIYAIHVLEVCLRRYMPCPAASLCHW